MGERCESILSGVNDDRTDFKYVGTWDHPGRQSWDMISGAALYPTDIWEEGTLVAMALRSPYGHAKVKSLDVSGAEKVEGVKLVLTYEDEELAAMPKSRPSYYEFGASPLLGDEAEFEGDEVGAVVVAINEETCKRALDAIKVEWEVLPFILDAREAAKPGAPILRPEMNPDSNMTGNTFGAPVEWENGNVEEGLKAADHVETFEYGRPMWSQFRSMPAAYFSYWADDPWGNPDGEKMCYVTNHAHFPSNGPIVSAWMGLGSYADKFRALTPYMASRYCDFVEKPSAWAGCPCGSSTRAARPSTRRFPRPTSPVASASTTTARSWPSSRETCTSPALAAATATRPRGIWCFRPTPRRSNPRSARTSTPTWPTTSPTGPAPRPIRARTCGSR